MKLEKGNTIAKLLTEYLKPYHTISIIGTAKNAGKTTVLNQIIKEYKNTVIALSSIGLDGEKIDNITAREKPRIKVYPQMILATAQACLTECYFDYEVIEKTAISSPLGDIVIIKVLTEGLALVAGPSTITAMKEIVEIFKKHQVTKILIDGALFRKSLASIKVSDATVLATGASYAKNIDKVVEDTALLVEELTLKEVEKDLYELLINERNSLVMDKKNNKTVINLTTLLNNEKTVKTYLTKKTKYLYLTGALTNKLVQVMIDQRFILDDLTIIVKDSTHIIVDPSYMKKLKLTNTKVLVLKQLNVLFLTYNPSSPFGYHFKDDLFKQKLTEKINLPIINVLKDLE